MRLRSETNNSTSGIVVAVLILAASLGPAIAGQQAADIDQIRNGAANSPISPAAWVNGNAGTENAHYVEGYSVAYRLRLTNLKIGAHEVQIEWDIRQGGFNALDYITHYERLNKPTHLSSFAAVGHPPDPQFNPEDIDPTIGVTGVSAGSFNTFPIPAPSSAGSTVPGQPTASFNALPAAERVLTIFNGTITGASYMSEGGLTAIASPTRLRINFTVTKSTAVIAWGAHIATGADWGIGHSASALTGSPYHTRLISLDGAGGNQDRSLKAGAVIVQCATCSAGGTSPVECGSTNTHTSTINTAAGGVCDNPQHNWSINGNGQIVGSNTGSSVTVGAGSVCGGSYTITDTVTCSGCTSATSLSCTQTVSIVDTTPPGLTCPVNARVECGGSTSPTATGSPSATDGCSTPGIGFSDSFAPACGNTGVITRTWTATDACRNAASCAQAITTVDTTLPVFNSFPTDRTVECTVDTTPATTGEPTAGDTCGSVAISYSDSSTAGCGNNRVITRTWKATDACGNVTSRDQKITMVDTTKPAFNSFPADGTVECTGNTTPAATGEPTATDTCGSAAISYSDSSTPGCGNNRVITRTWKATDACGNVTSRDQKITTVDTTPPVFNDFPADRTVECTAGTTPTATGEATGSDTCGNVGITYSDSSSMRCGNTKAITRAWKATDACGNVTTRNQAITTEDTTLPSVNCPSGTSVECGLSTEPSATGTASGSDTCGSASLSFADSFTPDCGNTGAISRVWSATDDCNNVNTCTQLITIVDTTRPLIACPPEAQMQCGPPPPATDTGGFVSQSGTASDSCGTVTVAFEDDSGTCPNIVRTYKATDACGNTNTCTQSFTAPSLSNALSDQVAHLLSSGDLVVGVQGARSLTIPGGASAGSSASCITSKMSVSGLASPLPGSGDGTLDTTTCQSSPPLPLQEDGTWSNVLLGHTITLALGQRVNTYFPLGNFVLAPTFCTQGALPGPDGLLGTSDDELDLNSASIQFMVPTSVLQALGAGATASDLLHLANAALAEEPTGGAGLADIAASLDAINRGFDLSKPRLLIDCPAPAP